MSKKQDRGINVAAGFSLRLNTSDRKTRNMEIWAINGEQEDVDVIGISSSMGEHLYIASNLVKALNEQKIEIPVIRGGVIPSRDIPELLDIGVKKVFGPGSAPSEIVDFAFEMSKN
ncbi:MAG: hypothetical protein QMD03_07820 [Syntrophales bacterium]|nr:hypothetical protein [Syntrophales bacterium]